MPRIRISILLSTLILVLTHHSVLGYLDDYSPFTKTKPKLFHLRDLAVLERGESGSFVIFGSKRAGKAIPLIRIAAGAGGDDDGNDLFVYDRTGKAGARMTFPNDCSLTLSTAYAADLNRDGVDDFVVILKTSATGLGTYEYYVLFVLSSKNDYRISVLKSWDVDEKDFVDINNDGHCQFILVSLVYPDQKLGIKHSYWAYDLLEAHGTILHPANYYDRRFPIWVWYTNKPNHRGSLPVSRLVARKLLEARLSGSRD